MQFLIADTFQASLNKLNNQEQKAAKITVFDLQADPSSPGLKFHKLDRARDPNFWSVRVNRDVRLIVHRTKDNMLIAFVGHHDDAYAWAERRRIEVHPRTGAAQMVELSQTAIEQEDNEYFSRDVPMSTQRQRLEPSKHIAARKPSSAPREPLLFANKPDDESLLGYGVPEAWLADVRQVTESTLFKLLDHLPQEAAEALLELATGGTPKIPEFQMVPDPFAHPDAKRRFRVMDNVEELELALDFPWEKWTVFLHPVQRRFVERQYNGPARVGGTAGTGKTVVALHRAVRMARENPESRILLTTFSETLAENLKIKLWRLEADKSVLDRIHIKTLDQVALDLQTKFIPDVTLASQSDLDDAIVTALKAASTSFDMGFIREEWNDVVDAWGISTWETYRSVPRLGRKMRLGVKQREELWDVFEALQTILNDRGLSTLRMVQERIAGQLQSKTPLYRSVVVDEAQDIGVAQLRFVQCLVGNQPDGLFFAGDLGQRIFQSPFSWKALGVDIRGRSFTLKINYRTSHQIRTQADRLLPAIVLDIDGVAEDRRGVVSVFDGLPPSIHLADTEADETRHVAEWVARLLQRGVSPEEVGIIVRSASELARARAAADAVAGNAGDVAITCITMHQAKGLEFRAVAVMACDDEVIPDQDRIETVTDESDLQEVYVTERHLLYVACTRARDHLLVTGVAPGSEFLADMTG